jgi:DNA-directed RNA polymerase omega subunit
MARITSQLAAEKIGGQFKLVLVAAQRARQLKRNDDLPKRKGEGIVVSAIRDVEEGRYGWDEYIQNFVPTDIAGSTLKNRNRKK